MDTPAPDGPRRSASAEPSRTAQDERIRGMTRVDRMILALRLGRRRT